MVSPLAPPPCLLCVLPGPVKSHVLSEGHDSSLKCWGERGQRLEINHTHRVGQALKTSPGGGRGKTQSRPTAGTRETADAGCQGDIQALPLTDQVTFAKLAFSSLFYQMGGMIATARRGPLWGLDKVIPAKCSDEHLAGRTCFTTTASHRHLPTLLSSLSTGFAGLQLGAEPRLRSKVCQVLGARWRQFQKQCTVLGHESLSRGFLRDDGVEQGVGLSFQVLQGTQLSEEER